jgi:type IV pilus assembly PilX-like protein
MRQNGSRKDDMRPSQDESGFALILAILALLLLTFLGITLAQTTSTELQIATNYRWSQQALYNAEAGVEAAKALLKTVNWVGALPVARNVAGVPVVWNGAIAPFPNTPGGGAVAPQARNDQWGNATRNFENWQCDLKGNGMGYGVVLDDASAAGPQQFRTTLLGNDIMGATTLWVRRPTWNNADGTLSDLSSDIDATGDDVLILTAEGIAPFSGGTANMRTSAASRAVQVIEVVLRQATLEIEGPCGGRAGQAGGGAEGAGFGGCDPITAGGVRAGVPGGSMSGTGTDIVGAR